MEEFKDVKGYEGHYKVSNLGNVISLKHGKVKALKQDGYNGYKCVRLSKNNKNRKFTVHRLVAEAFLNTNIKGLTVNHIDLNKSNNCVENLEVISLRENITHAIINGAYGYKTVLKEDDIINIRESSLPQKELCKIYNIDQASVSRIKNKKSYKWVK